jgi:general secretion pathway protein J
VKHSTKRGFTLLEVLIAMTILAIVLVIAYRVFSSSYAALHRVDPQRDPFQTARVILDRMAEELQSAYYRPGLSYTGFLGEDDIQGDAPGDSLIFSSLANFYWIKSVEGINESDFLKIAYLLVEDQEEQILIRAQDPSFSPFEESAEDLGTSDRGVHQLTDEVWGVDFRYLDGEEWLEEWNAEDRQKIPDAVEVTLILETEEGTRLPFYAVIPVGVSSGRPSGADTDIVAQRSPELGFLFMEKREPS